MRGGGDEVAFRGGGGKCLDGYETGIISALVIVFQDPVLSQTLSILAYIINNIY